MALLTGPTDLPKYSYSKKLGIESVHWYAVNNGVTGTAERRSGQGEDIYGEPNSIKQILATRASASEQQALVLLVNTGPDPCLVGG